VPDRIDLNLWVYDAAGQYITGSGLMGDGLDEALEFEPAATGTYYLRVHRPLRVRGRMIHMRWWPRLTRRSFTLRNA